MYSLERRFSTMLSRAWWSLLLRGIVAIAFGLLTWLKPGISLTALVLVFGVYALTDGVLALAAAFSGRRTEEDWWVIMLIGALGVGVGILTLTHPGATALALLFYIAIWAIGKGVLEIVAAIHLRREIQNEWLLILGGVASVGFGALLLARPGAGALAVLGLIGLYALVIGAVLVVFAFKARKFGKQIMGYGDD